MIYIAALFLLALDQITKLIAINVLKPLNSVDFIKGVLGFTYVENKGIAFGLFQDKLYIFLPLSLVIVGICIYIFFKYRKENKLFDTSLMLVISGATGNIIDKFIYGYVVDFIEFKFIDFPVFNVADICVCTGACLLIIYLLFCSNGDKNAN